MKDAAIFIVGANGQLGTALKQQYPGAHTADISEMDITQAESVSNFEWGSIKYILNAAAYTNVDRAESPEGRVAAWNVNATAVANLVRVAELHDITLVHISTDYVFDGTKAPHKEDELFSPLSVYGQSKAAGDLVVSLLPKHYIFRTSWVIGEGKNFVRTMLELGQKGVAPSVVADQIGRLTFTSELVKVIDHFLLNQPAYGTYNASNSGEPASWADITRQIFKQAGYNLAITDTTTTHYFASRPATAPRPLKSTLSLDKLESTGFMPSDWQIALTDYISKELST